MCLWPFAKIDNWSYNQGVKKMYSKQNTISPGRFVYTGGIPKEGQLWNIGPLYNQKTYIYKNGRWVRWYVNGIDYNDTIL